MATATATAAEAEAAEAAEAAAAVEAQKTRNSFKNANVHQRGSPKMAEFVVVSLFCQIVLLNFLENFCIVLHYIAPLLLFFSFSSALAAASPLVARTRCPRKWSHEDDNELFCFVLFSSVWLCSVLLCFVLFA